MQSNKEKTDLMPGSKELTGSQALMSWVRDAVATVDWPNKEGQFQGYATTAMVMLEVYCCAKGAVGSEEMGDWIAPDPVLNELFPEKHPNPAVIMAFRKCHRKPIQQCLSRVFDIALIARFGDEDHHQTPIDYCVVRGLDAWFNPRCGPDSDREATERVQIPDWTDNMSELKMPRT